MNKKYKVNRLQEGTDESVVFPSIVVGGCLGNGSDRILRIISDQPYDKHYNVRKEALPKKYMVEFEDAGRTISTFLTLKQMIKIRNYSNERVNSKNQVILKEGRLVIKPRNSGKVFAIRAGYPAKDYGANTYTLFLEEEEFLKKNNNMTMFYINIDEIGFTALHEFFNKIDLGE